MSEQDPSKKDLRVVIDTMSPKESAELQVRSCDDDILYSGMKLTKAEHNILLRIITLYTDTQYIISFEQWDETESGASHINKIVTNSKILCELCDFWNSNVINVEYGGNSVLQLPIINVSLTSYKIFSNDYWYGSDERYNLTMSYTFTTN